MSGMSNVGGRGVYEAGDQVNYKKSEVQEHDRYNEGQPNSHLSQDSKDQQSISNKLAGEAKKESQPAPESEEVKQSKIDSTRPARQHGNEPSKGAKIDEQLREEEQEMMKKKGSFGSKAQ
ncbi:hypothetical protein KC332_g7386 [Hortaea werneckii]|uniref:Uncharacterized protein n=2 Tax=Hortaea werneckii TaxID=91943 RepID=A0A3M7HB82_HORWE|nr:hypothetical protein KC358_g7036 [Hortaea werneckii]OTA27954.1 hypothetical protein BTJ68_09786 [Hortaea werneckii EXF-2000]KAI6835070.1 hypothetical protein KC350_g6588 [Hortaea werneckii]KAI6901030.1 hypothetical protein KC348_g16600 [Hortaea werneckii]KAI6935550.1 hypothetical protein KC341_g6866 [Hortaea werneckii]